MKDWTEKNGMSNSSDAFVKMVDVVDDLIMSSSRDLIGGRSQVVARLIVAQLAHNHGFRPVKARTK
jgi:hypothetical protein